MDVVKKYEEERHKLEALAKKKGIEIYWRSNELYIKTDIGFWCICYDNKNDLLRLFHGNGTFESVPVYNPTVVSFHRQYDKPNCGSFVTYLEYIVKHDNFKKRLNDVDGDIRRISKSKKYIKAKKKREKKNSIRRVNKIFDELGLN